MKSECAAMRKSCIIMAEAQQSLLRSLKNLLEPHLEISATTDNVLSLLDSIESLTPDLVIVVVTYTSLDKRNLVRHLNQRFPDLVIIILSDIDEPLAIKNALKQNIRGYVLLHEVKDVLVPAVEKVLAGETYFPAAYEEPQS